MSLRVDLVWSMDFVPGKRLESQKSPLAAISAIEFPDESSLKEFIPSNTFHFRVMKVDTLFSPKVHLGGPMQYRSDRIIKQIMHKCFARKITFSIF